MGYEPIWKFENNKFVGIVWVESVKNSEKENQEVSAQELHPIKEAS